MRCKGVATRHNEGEAIGKGATRRKNEGEAKPEEKQSQRSNERETTCKGETTLQCI